MPHLLVVDDHRDICEMVCAALDGEGGWRASSALTPSEALRIIDSDRPDGAIVDAVLRQASGIRLAGQILRRNIPVLLMTGEPETLQRLTRLGCPHLAKPFRLEQLFAEVRTLLAEGEARMAELRGVLRHLAASRAELRIPADRLTAALAPSAASRRRRQAGRGGDKNG